MSSDQDKVVKLTVVGNIPIPSAGTQMLEEFDRDVKEMREWLVAGKAAGFALLAYDLTNEGGSPHLHSWVTTFCHHPGDSFWLADMAKQRIHQRLHEK